MDQLNYYVDTQFVGFDKNKNTLMRQTHRSKRGYFETISLHDNKGNLLRDKVIISPQSELVH